MQLLTASASPATPAPRVSRITPQARLQRCGGTACAAGTCGHDEPEVARFASGPTPAPTPALARRAHLVGIVQSSDSPPPAHEVLSSAGQPLAASTRTFMESRFGHDFGRVRVHADAQAAASARALNAWAFTVGPDVVFGAARYEPATKDGLSLLAHELTHVIQQGRGARGQDRMRTARDSDGTDHEAESVASAVMRGGSLPPIIQGSSGVQRACGPAAIGSVAGCTGRGGDITDFGGSSEFLFRFERACDQFLPGEQERLRLLSDRITGFDHVEIDGFASEEGPAAFNEDLSCARARAAESVLAFARALPLDISLFKHGTTRGPREDRRSVVVTLRRELRSIRQDETDLLNRLERLADAAVSEAVPSQSVRLIWRAEDFGQGIRQFKRTLKLRLESLHEGDPLPDDLRLVLEALMLWSNDPGNQWGEGIWDSRDLVMSAADYVTVPAGQYKCNAYVAEVAYRSFSLVQRVYESEQQPGRFFPYQAKDWGNANLAIPHFGVVTRPDMGDIWSNGSHTGIYLGTYTGHRLYISARDDGSGVWGLNSEIQKAHGIQIKELQAGGVYRRYTP
jgi:hypothetical protein